MNSAEMRSVLNPDNHRNDDHHDQDNDDSDNQDDDDHNNQKDYDHRDQDNVNYVQFL